jgi:hypothetical protein
MIGELTNDKTRMGKEISQQKAQIRILNEMLNNIGFTHEHGDGGGLFPDKILRVDGCFEEIGQGSSGSADITRRH